MKKTLILALFMLVMLIAGASGSAKAMGGVSFGVFYSSLSDQGEWIDCNLGYVWRPSHVAAGWRPYLYGRWIWTDYGWYWVSAEPFGWATFHYGRWYYDDYYGWLWVPDQVWGPSWVEWRYDDDYIGWAPLAPYASFSYDDGISYAQPWVSPYHYWSFVTYHNFTADRMADCVQPVDRNPRIFGSTRGVLDIRSSGNGIINRGIEVNAIERRGNIHVRTADVIDRNDGGDHLVRDGSRDRIEAFRPRLDARLRDQVSRPRDASVANRRIATDFEQNAREKHQDRIRSIDREPSPMTVPPRERPSFRVPGQENRRPVDRTIPGGRIDQGRSPDRAPADQEKSMRFPRPGREVQKQNPGNPPSWRDAHPPAVKRDPQQGNPPSWRELRPPAVKREPPRQQERAPAKREQGNDPGGKGRRGGGPGW